MKVKLKKAKYYCGESYYLIMRKRSDKKKEQAFCQSVWQRGGEGRLDVWQKSEIWQREVTDLTKNEDVIEIGQRMACGVESVDCLIEVRGVVTWWQRYRLTIKEEKVKGKGKE